MFIGQIGRWRRIRLTWTLVVVGLWVTAAGLTPLGHRLAAAQEFQPAQVEIRIDPSPPAATVPASIAVLLHSSMGGSYPAPFQLGVQARLGSGGQSFTTMLNRRFPPLPDTNQAPLYTGHIAFPNEGAWEVSVPKFYPAITGSSKQLTVVATNPVATPAANVEAQASPTPATVAAIATTPDPPKYTVLIDRGGAEARYLPGEMVQVTYAATLASDVKLTRSGPRGLEVLYEGPIAGANPNFNFTVNEPGAYLVVLEAYLSGQLVGTASSQFMVETPKVSLTIDRAKTNATYKIGEPIAVTFEVEPMAIIRITDTDPLGGSTVVYDPGEPVVSATVPGVAGFPPGEHTLTIAVVVNGNVIATATATYIVTQP